MPRAHIERNAHARTMHGPHWSSRLTILHISRPTMARPLVASAETILNNRRPYHGTGSNGQGRYSLKYLYLALNSKDHKLPGTSEVHKLAGTSKDDKLPGRVGFTNCLARVRKTNSGARLAPLSRANSAMIRGSCGVQFFISTRLICLYAHRGIVVRLYYSTPVLCGCTHRRMEANICTTP